MTIGQPAVGAATRLSGFRKVATGDGRDVLGRSSTGSSAGDRASRPAWWIDPTWVPLLVCAPVLLVTLSQGPAMLGYFKNFVDNYTPDNCRVALASLLALVGGTIVGKLTKASAAAAEPIDPLRVRQVLRWLGIVSL